MTDTLFRVLSVYMLSDSNWLDKCKVTGVVMEILYQARLLRDWSIEAHKVPNY